VLVFCTFTKALREIHRVLKPGGYLALTEAICVDEIAYEHFDTLKAGMGLPDLQLVKHEHWLHTLNEAGFIIEWTHAQAPNWLQTLMVPDLPGLTRQQKIALASSVGYGLYVARKDVS
jgi:SAM-dependent methyltransferase